MRYIIYLKLKVNKYVGGIHQRGYVVYFRIYEQQTFYTYAQSAHMKGEFCMNNKFIARVAAVAIGAAMLSTAAFAADPTIDKTAGSLDVTNAYTTVAGQEYVTMMAYAVPDDTANDFDSTTDKMIALEQVAATTGLTTVGFDTNKVDGMESVIVKIGGGSDVSTFTLPLAVAGTFTKYYSAEDTSWSEVEAADTLTYNDVEYTNVKVVKASYTPVTADQETVKEVGVLFGNKQVKSDDMKQFTVKYDKNIESEGTVTFKVAIIGIPDGKTVYAFPYATGTNVK